MNRSKGISINRESIIVFLFLGMLSYIFQGIILMSRINLADAISLSMVFIIIMYLMLFIVSKRQISRVSFFRTLLLLSLFFYFGQHILVLFGSSYLATTTNYTIISCNVSDQNVIRATFFIARMILVLYLGYGIGCKGDAFAISFERDDDTRSEKDRNYTKLVFSIIFWVCVIPAFIVAIYRMGLAASIGYSELRDMDDTVYTSAGTFMVICSYIQNWFLPALYMNLLLSNRRKRIFYLLILAIYSLLYVLSGSRFTLLKIGVVVFLIIYVWEKELERKDIFKLCALLVILGVIMSVFSSIRNNISSDSFVSALSSLKGADFISPIFWETGITFHSVSNLMQHCPSDVPFACGSSYIGAILACLPSFMRGNFLASHEMSVSRIFSPYFYGNKWVGYGSSFIAEAYYNLGILTPIFILLLGIFIGKLESSFHIAAKKKDYCAFFLILYLFGELSYGVRTDLWGIPRWVLLYALLPVILVRIMSKIKVR